MAVPDQEADLRRYLRDARDALLWKLEGLRVRRPPSPGSFLVSQEAPVQHQDPYKGTNFQRFRLARQARGTAVAVPAWCWRCQGRWSASRAP